MAQFAGSRESSRNVIYRRERIVVVGLVAAYAGHRCDVVVAIDMAIGALPRRNRVHPGQGKPGRGVIKHCIRPQDCVMTLLARLWEARGDVIRIGGSLIVLKMTTHARRGCDVVVAVDMTIGALPWRRRVHAR